MKGFVGWGAFSSLILITLSVFAAAPVTGYFEEGRGVGAPVEKTVLNDFISRLNQLQEEVRQLRGLVEEQAHALQQLKQQQQQAYTDLEQRLKDGVNPKLRKLPIESEPPPAQMLPPPSYEEVMPPKEEAGAVLPPVP